MFEESGDLPTQTVLIGDVLANETDPLFLWQFDESSPCPKGCERSEKGSTCQAIQSHGHTELR